MTLAVLKLHDSIFIALIGDHGRPKSRMTDGRQWSSTNAPHYYRGCCGILSEIYFMAKRGWKMMARGGGEEWNRNSFYNQAIFMYTIYIILQCCIIIEFLTQMRIIIIAHVLLSSLSYISSDTMYNVYAAHCGRYGKI